MARTEIKNQDRQEAAVGAASAVSACHCETVLDSTGYRCRPPGPLRPLQATVPRAVAAAAGGGRRRIARQEGSACRSSRESCSHEASGQACCQSAGESARRSVRTIRSLERADTPHEICSLGHANKQTIAFSGALYGGAGRASRISSNFWRLRPDDFAFCSGSETRTI